MVEFSAREIATAQKWLQELFSDTASLPFSFRIGERVYHGFSGELANPVCTDDGNGWTLTAHHPSGIEVSAVVRTYPNHAAFEWTLYFTNAGSADSPVLSDVHAAEMTFPGADPALTYFIGDDNVDPFAYAPQYALLRPGLTLTLEPRNGRPTNFQFPYYYLSGGDGGYIVSVGWSGQWRAAFHAGFDRVQLTAGQSEFCSYLKPGETVRSPLMTFMRYDSRDEGRIINLWRRFFIDCNMRKVNAGLLPPVLSASTSWLYNEMKDATEENQIQAFDAYRAHGIPLDFWWMDAGWYYKGIEKNEPIESWVETGSWLVDDTRFPARFADVSDHVHRCGGKTLLWFEPERVTGNSYLASRPEWLLGGDLANFGSSDFRAWLTDRVDSILTEGKIDLYRQDFNIDPLHYWQLGDKAEGANRTGITENQYVQGYLAYWDALIQRHPDMMLDSCASGGRRNDLETMRRAVPLHKTDADYSDFTKKHGMHHSLYRWFPYYGTPVTGPGYTGIDEYSMRSAYVPWMCMCYDIRPDGISDEDFAKIKRCTDEWRTVNDCFYGDYYPLTPHTNDPAAWIGWEFITADKGILQLYRHPDCVDDTITVSVQGIDPDAVYEFTDIDTGVTTVSPTLTVTRKTAPCAVIVTFKKK